MAPKKQEKNTGRLTKLRKEIQWTQLSLIILITILLSVGGLFINLSSNNKSVNQSLQNISELITRIYKFTINYDQANLRDYMDKVVFELPDVDVVSIIDVNNNRVYHTNHELINSQYDGIIPNFENHPEGFYTEDSIGPSGPQRRTYSAVYSEDGIYEGFIMTIKLKSNMYAVIFRILVLFLGVTIGAICVEVLISRFLSKRIKKEFLAFTEDFEGTKFLVDSMRANNHDFTNKLHVILGLVQIGEYEKAISYIENISIIQRETISKVMHSIENPSFAALIIGKIARASECNVKFILKDNICFHEDHIQIPSEALVTITGNLIDNALDAMNMDENSQGKSKELVLGIFTKPGELLITVKDTGPGIPIDIWDRVFEHGFSTKGEGRGIGLYHSKQLVESLGGKISFETQNRCGTCFMVILEK